MPQKLINDTRTRNWFYSAQARLKIARFFAMTHSLSEGENALVGIAAGIADITCIQWAYYLKNARQQRLPLTLNPRLLYRGYVANCGNIAAGTSFQFATAGALNKLVLRGERRELTDAEKVCTGSGHVCVVVPSGLTPETLGDPSR